MNSTVKTIEFLLNIFYNSCGFIYCRLSIKHQNQLVFMNQTTCILCGVVHHNSDQMCETCRQMMAGNVETVTAPAFNAPPSYSETVVPQTFNQSFQSNQDANSNYQQNQSFQPLTETSAYQYSPPPPRYSPPPMESEYKPSIWNWITDLPIFVKIGLGVLIFSICFAAVLKGFMQMDVSVVQTDVKAANLEPQKPWFSAWFRSKPTAEEIFDKFETVSNIKGKNVSLQSLQIIGKGEYLRVGADPASDLAALKKGAKPVATVAPNPNKAQELPEVKTQVTTQTDDFDVRFEIAMKNPNKKLTKMTETPKTGYSRDFFIFPTSGFDGTKGWKFTKSVINGVTDITDQAYINNSFLLNQTIDGITITFVRSMFAKIEFVGEAIVSNRKCYTIKTTDLAGESSNLFFDIETGLINKVSQNNSDTYILDYQNFDGTMLPSKIAYPAGKQWLVLTTENMQKDVQLDDAIFRRSAYLELSKTKGLR